MTDRTITRLVGGSLASLAALAACAELAAAHPASVTCNPIPSGTPILTADKWGDASVADIIEKPDAFVVTWTDGYVRTVLKPTNCPVREAPPAPVLAPEVVPAPAPSDQTTVEVVITPKPKPNPRKPAAGVTCQDLRRLGAGRKWYARMGCVPPPRPRHFGPSHPFRGVAG